MHLAEAKNFVLTQTVARCTYPRTNQRRDRYSHGVVTVPYTNRDIPIGTLRSIFRQAGWDWRTRR